jgi:hypothetical protein
MKLSRLSCLVLLAWPCAFAQETPAQVTDAQVDFYQRGIEAGCKDAGRRHGDPVEQVDSFCNCVVKTLKAEVTAMEWRQAYFHSVRHEADAEQTVMAPHMSHLGACRGAL